MRDTAAIADARYAAAQRRVREHLYPARCRLDYAACIALMDSMARKGRWAR